jgi:VanZ family protein
MTKKFIVQYRRNPWLIAAWVFYCLMIVLGSFRFLERGFVMTFNDKLLHFFAYAVLASLIFWGLKFPILQRLLATLSLVAVMGMVDEYLQNFTGRDPSFDDWLADMSGGILSLICIFFLKFIIWLWRVARSGDWRQAMMQLVQPRDFDEET